MCACLSAEWGSVMFHPAKRSGATRQSLGVGPGGALVLYAGRLSKEKNLPVLLNAFTLLTGKHPNARLVLAGEGPGRRSLVKSYRSPGITFISWNRGEELATLFASADVFALPSTTETLSLVALESMASSVSRNRGSGRCPRISDGRRIVREG